jgi:ParB family chromosome partitioning protein
MLEMALVENIQREDLNSIEVAISYQRLIDECSLTQDQLSQKISKSRSSITNHIRLLKLPADIQAGVRDNLISMGHARALVSAGDESLQLAIFNKILLESLSVRDVEILIRQGHLKPENIEIDDIKVNKKTPNPVTELSNVQSIFKEHLSDKLASKIEVSKTVSGAGKIIINFNSEVDLNRIIEILNK